MLQFTAARAAIFPISIPAGWARVNCFFTDAIHTAKRSLAKYKLDITAARSMPPAREIQKTSNDLLIRFT